MGLRAAGAAGDRQRRREFRLRPAPGPLGQVPLRPRAAALRAPRRAAARATSRPSAAAVRDRTTRAHRRRRCSGPGWRPTRCAPYRPRARGDGAERAAAVLRLRRRHRAASRSARRATRRAIVAVNRGELPYGGIELARLYDADGDPIGGDRRAPARRPSASLIARPGGASTFATQAACTATPRARRRAHPLPARARDAHRGATRRSRTPGRSATRRAVGRVDGDGFRVTTAHAFRRNTIRRGTRSRARTGPGCAASASCSRPPGATRRRIEADSARRPHRRGHRRPAACALADVAGVPPAQRLRLLPGRHAGRPCRARPA